MPANHFELRSKTFSSAHLEKDGKKKEKKS